MHKIKTDNFWNHFVPTASAICGVKTEYSGLKFIETHEESVTSYWSSLWVGNLTADKEDPDGWNVQTGLADRIA
jgi:hypothetical protein